MIHRRAHADTQEKSLGAQVDIVPWMTGQTYLYFRICFVPSNNGEKRGGGQGGRGLNKSKVT